MSITGRAMILSRDCDGILVPQGHVISLKVGTPVRVTQALGGSHTVEVYGNLVMIGAADQDVLGLEVKQEDVAHLSDQSLSIEDKAITQIKTCYDPEIPVNIHDLGLIYNISVNDLDQGSRVDVLMTLTSPTCGMGPFLVEDVKRKVHMIPEVSQVEVTLVFDPPWQKAMMTQAARLQLGLM